MAIKMRRSVYADMFGPTTGNPANLRGRSWTAIAVARYILRLAPASCLRQSRPLLRQATQNKDGASLKATTRPLF